MGVDTKGRIKGRISPKEIVRVIKEKFGVDAVSDVKPHDYGKLDDLDFTFEHYGNNGNWIIDHGFICFEINGDRRMLFYHYSNINIYENLTYYKKEFPERVDLEEMVKSETTNISLGCWKNSVEIIEAIVSAFGGWVDDNDCDDVPYRRIEKE
jgi:hypothetical protein